MRFNLIGCIILREDCVRGSTWIGLPCQLFISLKTSHVRFFADLFQILPGTQNNLSYVVVCEKNGSDDQRDQHLVISDNVSIHRKYNIF